MLLSKRSNKCPPGKVPGLHVTTGQVPTSGYPAESCGRTGRAALGERPLSLTARAG